MAIGRRCIGRSRQDEMTSVQAIQSSNDVTFQRHEPYEAACLCVNDESDLVPTLCEAWRQKHTLIGYGRASSVYAGSAVFQPSFAVPCRNPPRRVAVLPFTTKTPVVNLLAAAQGYPKKQRNLSEKYMHGGTLLTRLNAPPVTSHFPSSSLKLSEMPLTQCLTVSAKITQKEDDSDSPLVCRRVKTFALEHMSARQQVLVARFVYDAAQAWLS